MAAAAPAPQSSSSTSTLPLRKILEEPVLFKGFSDFCKVQHAYENLDFWLAVETFRETFRDNTNDPPTTPVSAANSPGSPISPTGRKSIRRTFWSLTAQTLPRLSSSKSMDETKDTKGDVTVLGQARRIYQEYLAPNADKWVCVDQLESDELKKKLDAGVVDYKLFDVVQKQVYINMEKDLVPRFSKTFEVDDQPSVFQSSQPVRGSVRFVPDQKLRATLVKTTAGSGSETEAK